MTVTMVSNALSHHQLGFCQAMAENKDIDFHYIATKSLTKERINMGYRDLNTAFDWIVRAYESGSEKQKAEDLIENSDFVLAGSAPYSMIKKRLRAGKWTFIASERILKNGVSDILNPRKFLPYVLSYAFVPHDKLCLLCASAYAARDFSLTGIRKQNMYKWGYFPPVSELDAETIISKKSVGTILWVGRMIDWKHPEYVLNTAIRLKKENIPFKLEFVGNGPLQENLADKAKACGLESCVSFSGSLSTDETRKRMEQANILLATSSKAEGWGAVINEGMSSACTVIASHAMGATPFMIRDGVNGLIFESGNEDDLYNKVKYSLQNPDISKKLGQAAADFVNTKWNSKIAADRLSALFLHLFSKDTDFVWEDGIASHADAITDKYLKTEINHEKSAVI